MFLKRFDDLSRRHDDHFAMIPLWTLWRYALQDFHACMHLHEYHTASLLIFFALNFILTFTWNPFFRMHFIFASLMLRFDKHKF